MKHACLIVIGVAHEYMGPERGGRARVSADTAVVRGPPGESVGRNLTFGGGESRHAFAILTNVDLNGRVRRSGSRRFAEHVESVAQAVAQRVIDLAVEVLDVNALIARVDLNVVLGRIELNSLLHRVDLNEVLNQVDLNQVLETVDLNELLDRVDMDKLMARVDINQLASRFDVDALVKNTDLGAIMVSSSSTLATEAIDLGRSHAVSMDDTLARWASKLRRNHKGQAGPPELPDAQAKP